jgi:ABC-type Fe3+-hydroxamate transport system substrate-binding protein
MIGEIGKLTNTSTQANELTHQLKMDFQRISDIGRNRKVLYAIWDDPLMVVGKETYIDSVLATIGFQNVINQPRYPTISGSNDVQPEIILLSSEPFPFSENHIKKYQEIFPDAEILLVDGEMFSWYGSKMLEAVHYFKSLSFTKR